MKKFLKALLIVILVLVIAVAGLLGWLTATEFRPGPVEKLSLRTDDASGTLETAQTLEILSWNVGYAGLGAESDFFMDGGKNSRSADKATVERYLQGIEKTIQGYDLVLLQEVDTDSSRSYGIDQAAALQSGDSVHALNYSCPFVPIPLPPIGKVNSGLLTISQADISEASRISLPCPFSWPLRIANLKRCLLVSRIGVEGTDRELVLVNLHLEAYDDGEGKLAQTQQLRAFLQEEYEKGNWVIAGGDFNQVFPGSLEVYPNTHPELWAVGALDESALPGQDWQFACDSAHPSCRLLNQPYDPADMVNTQYYVIDGFIVSPNVHLSLVETLDLGFENSDHNPVHLTVTLE